MINFGHFFLNMSKHVEEKVDANCVKIGTCTGQDDCNRSCSEKGFAGGICVFVYPDRLYCFCQIDK